MLKRFCFINLIVFYWIISMGVQSDNKEYNLKAAFIYNFTRFIEWDTLNNRNEFIIGVINSSPITESFEEIARTKTVNNKKIIIRHFYTAEEISDCDILFISENSKISLKEILDKTKSKNTLTISEQEGYAKQGTAINFIVINAKLKFEANTKALKSAGLTASSQLLKLAVIVE
ncbi:MAG: YfiR family protein [Bacteroidia bacterium]|nr:YfiR family protein [Bacteroidia bacterium]